MEGTLHSKENTSLFTIFKYIDNLKREDMSISREEYIRIMSLPYTDFYNSITINDFEPQVESENYTEIIQEELQGKF